MTRRSGSRYLAVLLSIAAAGCIVVVQYPEEALAQQRQSARQQQPTREIFSQRLHEYAKATAGADRGRYFAIVRRGMDRFDELAESAGTDAVRQSGIVLTAIDATPTPADLDPSSQAITSLRVKRRYETNSRIVGGLELFPGTFEEVVALSGKGFLCTGVALDGRRVLTAAHCVCDLGLQPPDPESVKLVRVGLSINRGDAKQTRDIDPTATRTYPNTTDSNSVAIDCNDVETGVLNGRLDLAVVQIRSDQPDIQVRPIRILDPDLFEAKIPRRSGGKPFYIFGFGCSVPMQPRGRFLGCEPGRSGVKAVGAIFRVLNCAPISSGGFDPKIGIGDPATMCAPDAAEFALSDYIVTDKMAIDSCGGDSGGPVLWKSPDDTSENAYQLVGVTSRSLHSEGHCGYGGIYTKVANSAVMTWIQGIRPNAP